jgi:hypothetical protein
VIVGWAVATDDSGKVLRCALAGSDGHTRIATTIRELFIVRDVWQESETREVWFVSDDAGVGPNLAALSELLPEFKLSNGIHSPGRGLWCAVLEGPEGYIRKLRLYDAGMIAGIEPGKVPPCSMTDATDVLIRAEMARDRVLYTQHVLNKRNHQVSLSLSGSGAMWTRYELVPGGGSDANTKRTGVWKSWARRRLYGRYPVDGFGWTPASDAFAEPAYVAGRIERYAREIRAGRLYDRHSAFAHAITLPLPTSFLTQGGGEPPSEANSCAIIRARVSVPDGPFAPLPYRMPDSPGRKGRVFYPTGEWEGTFTDEELAFAVECGVEVRPVHWWQWDCDRWLAPYVNLWWSVRRESSDPRERDIAKQLLASLYGKLAQGGEFENVSTDAAAFSKAMSDGKQPNRVLVKRHDSAEMIPLYLIPDTRSGPMRHMAAACFVTARARIKLGREIRRLLAEGSDVGAVHTDSVSTTGVVACSNELGGWKQESEFARGELLSSTCLAYLTDRHWDIRAAGLSLPRESDAESESMYSIRCDRAWNTLRARGKITVRHPRGFKTGIAANEVGYKLETRTYEASPHGIDSRHFDTDGSSRPWTVRELQRIAAG